MTTKTKKKCKTCWYFIHWKGKSTNKKKYGLCNHFSGLRGIITREDTCPFHSKEPDCSGN